MPSKIIRIVIIIIITSLALINQSSATPCKIRS